MCLLKYSKEGLQANTLIPVRGVDRIFQGGIQFVEI